MSTVRKWVRAGAFVGIGLLGAVTLGGDMAHWGPQFEIVEPDEGRVVLTQSIEPGAQLTLEHTHSVHQRPVEEVFSLHGAEGLALEEIRYDATGANLPSRPEQIGDVTTTVITDGDGYRVLHHGRMLGSVPLRVGGPNVDHVVTLPDGQRVRLLDIARRGAHLELRMRSPGTM